MVFPSFVFLQFFLPALIILYYVVFRNNIKRQNILLLFASLFFYSWGEPTFVFVMLACIIVNWWFGVICAATDRNETICGMKSVKFRKLAFSLTVIADLGLLAYYKYAAFVIANINRVLPFELSVPSIALPIGISFFTFQALSYTFDVFRGRVKPQEKLSYVALYISLFPQLVAGPIVRYSTIEHELDNRKFNWDDFSQGVGRFIIGLGKKVIIANIIAEAANYTFNNDPASLSVAAAWVGAGAYALQIYFDFSGYSDMAIGLGKMFGFHFLENFNYPYISRSISEFWRRWHISLSSWFRDYVYFPLGGSRVKSKGRLVFNLFVVWVLTGFWHGASWTFVGWGLMFFFLIAFEKITGFGKLIERIPVIGNMYMLICVMLGWTLFRSTGGASAMSYLLSMFGLNNNPFVNDDVYMLIFEYSFTWVIGIIACFPIAKKLASTRFSDMPVMVFLKWSYSAVVLILSLVLLSGSNFNPFIYFNF
ncbi:MAG: MBOAT family protein [Oscillospiraceae bacterium]|nr:MBOAT family protein [Oscillospiraceae bacterium]